ncbi:XRE family transcriptional regulator [Schaedlerella arabinosiphila]|uniref:XRE family transcriptional regulator n=1 Tax=Schaedlerella arabinosiphila TaxID=2044587 RepID=A0A3R8JJE4_9FIRM|nr:helix-turn-helix transcriptional regulator [Schaedlerella arabinosiphila]RRK30322.1 XRE family transcriptional regulator [Schaedlerella arabinosiphila]
MNIAAIIIEIRKQRKMTQEDFAKLFHVTRQTVSNWENEKSYPDIKTLVEISDEFDISLDNPADH